MPNYVKNIVTFKGTKEKLEELLSYLKQDGRDELDFNLIIPTPKELLDVESDDDEVDVAIGEYLMDGTTILMYQRTLMYRSVRAEMEDVVHRSYSTDGELIKAYMAHKLLNDYLEDTYWKKCIRWYANYKKIWLCRLV